MMAGGWQTRDGWVVPPPGHNLPWAKVLDDPFAADLGAEGIVDYLNALEAENARLRAALQRWVDYETLDTVAYCREYDLTLEMPPQRKWIIDNLARAALEVKE